MSINYLIIFIRQEISLLRERTSPFVFWINFSEVSFRGEKTNSLPTKPLESKRQFVSPAVEKRTWKSELQSMDNTELFLNCSWHLHRISVDSRSSLKIVWILTPNHSRLGHYIHHEACYLWSLFMWKKFLSQPAHTPHKFPSSFPFLQSGASQIFQMIQLEMLIFLIRGLFGTHSIKYGPWPI